MTGEERRNTFVPVEARAGDRRTIGGYAAKFNRMSQNLGGFVEQIHPQFFNKSRGDGWPGVMARYNHDDNLLLGTTAAGTLRLTINSVGLGYEVDLPHARTDVYELVARGDVRQSSFAFIAFEDDWSTTDQGFPLRTLLTGRAIDVAPVNTPAYEDTSVAQRSLAARFDASLDEVRRLSAAGDLTKFFRRSDTARSPRAALAKALALTVDSDPLRSR
jgi:HK97 family phage prohead protease